MTNEGFVFDGPDKWDSLMLFWRTCRMYDVRDYADRVMLLRKITARKKATYIRDAKTFLKGHNAIDLTRELP